MLPKQSRFKKVCSMIVLPSVTKAQAEWSYRTQVQLFETNKLQSKNIKQQTRNQNNPKNTQWFTKGPTIQGHTSTLKYETRQRFVINTRMFVCVYALPECSSPLALALASISMVDLRSTWLACCHLFFTGTYWRCCKITTLIGWLYHENVKWPTLLTGENVHNALEDPYVYK